MQELKRIAKKEEKIKISKRALIVLAKELEKHLKNIIKKANFFVKKDKRKIISEKDIQRVVEEKSLI